MARVLLVVCNIVIEFRYDILVVPFDFPMRLRVSCRNFQMFDSKYLHTDMKNLTTNWNQFSVRT